MLSVLIPAHNEAENLAPLMEQDRRAYSTEALARGSPGESCRSEAGRGASDKAGSEVVELLEEQGYEVQVEGEPSESDLETLRKGIFLEGKRTAPARMKVVRRTSHRTLLRLEIHEGRKREIRKMFEALGYPVAGLLRVRFGVLTLEGLKPGQWRYLKKQEIERLKKLAA